MQLESIDVGVLFDEIEAAPTFLPIGHRDDAGRRPSQ